MQVEFKPYQPPKSIHEGWAAKYFAEVKKPGLVLICVFDRGRFFYREWHYEGRPGRGKDYPMPAEVEVEEGYYSVTHQEYDYLTKKRK